MQSIYLHPENKPVLRKEGSKEKGTIWNAVKLFFGCDIESYQIERENVKPSIHYNYKERVVIKNKNDVKITKDLKRESLTRILSTPATQDMLRNILKRRDFFLENTDCDYKKIYRYINGFTDETGEAIDLSIDKKYFREYFFFINSLKYANKSTRLQGSDSNYFNEDDVKFIYDEVFFQSLSNEDEKLDASSNPQELLLSLADKYDAKNSQNSWRSDEKNQFESLIKSVEKYRSNCKRFIVLSKNIKLIVSERVYIKFDPTFYQELSSLLVKELLDQQIDFGIHAIKFAGPSQVKRSDGIVIYIGGSDLRQAEENRKTVVAKLTDMKKKYSDYFTNDPMPFKQCEAGGGIATIPYLSTDKSFTNAIARAVGNALKAFPDVQDVDLFQQKIIDAYGVK